MKKNMNLAKILFKPRTKLLGLLSIISALSFMAPAFPSIPYMYLPPFARRVILYLIIGIIAYVITNTIISGAILEMSSYLNKYIKNSHLCEIISIIAMLFILYALAIVLSWIIFIIVAIIFYLFLFGSIKAGFSGFSSFMDDMLSGPLYEHSYIDNNGKRHSWVNNEWW